MRLALWIVALFISIWALFQYRLFYIIYTNLALIFFNIFAKLG